MVDGGGIDAGPVPVCEPDSQETCDCPGGSFGIRNCFSDGSGYGGCECGPATCMAIADMTGDITDTCPADQICVCPRGGDLCNSGECGPIGGRTYQFALGNYAAPLYDAAGDCFDDVFSPCNDPPDLVVQVGIEGFDYGAYTATDTPSIFSGVWNGTFSSSSFFAALTIDRTYYFKWDDADFPDANDPIGEAYGSLSNEDLRRRKFLVGTVVDGVFTSGVVVYVTPQPL
jgi:hypothetical protein